MNEKFYINIQGWMRTELDLKSNELILYALIYGFSQDGKSRCKSSISYIMESLGVSNKTAINLINRLLDKKFIKKYEGEDCNEYSYLRPSVKSSLVKKVHRGSVKSSQVGSVKSSHNNNIYNNSNNIPLTADENIKEFKKYEQDKQRHINLIGRYYLLKVKMKQLKPFPTLEALRKDFKRQLKPASELKDYDDKRIKEAINKSYNMTDEWTLLTVCKYINKN